MLKKLWMDEGGALLSVELILLIVITVIGITVGMVVLRDAVVAEFQDVAAAVSSIDPGYGWAGLVYTDLNGTTAPTNAYVNGSYYDSDIALNGGPVQVLSEVIGTNNGDATEAGSATVSDIP